MRILVVGAGVAGLTAAAELSLKHRVTLIERDAALRTEGYMIDFFGPGFDVAERLGLLPALEAVHYPVAKFSMVDEHGAPRAEIPYPRIRSVMFRGRHFNFMRGDLERVLFDRVPGEVDVRFGTWVERLDIGPAIAHVVMNDGCHEDYDLVVGADGVHSSTRRRVLDPADGHEASLDCHTAAYVISSTPSSLEPDAFVSLSDTNMTVAAYPIRGGRTATFFLYRAEGPVAERTRDACARELEAAFRGRGKLADELLDAFPDEDGVYFDDVVQVEIDRWSRGPVVLIGDACGAVSLLAGQGASMAIAGAYILARELEKADDIPGALARYEARVRPAVVSRQRSGRRNAGWALPKSHFRAVLRDRLSDLVVRSPFARMMGSALGGQSMPLD